MLRTRFITAGALLASLAVLHPDPVQGADASLDSCLDELEVVLGANDADPDVYMRQIEEFLVSAEAVGEAELIGEMISHLEAAEVEETAIGEESVLDGWLMTLSFLRNLYAAMLP